MSTDENDTAHDAPHSEPPLSDSALVREVARLRAHADTLNDEIEELREAQTLLETSRDDYAEIHDLAPVPLLTLGKEGSIRSANLAAAELFEQERGSLILRQFRGFILDSDRMRVAEHLAKNGKGVRRACDVRLTLTNGNVVPVQLWARASWRRPGVQHLTLVDLREREFDAWEKRQLAEAAQRARAASESKDQFIAMLSHELRAPLTPVLAAATALRSAPALTQELRDVFEVIERNVNAEARLIDDLLDATGIAKGKLRLMRKPIDVHSLLHECIGLVRAQAEHKGISLGFVPAAEHAVAAADSLRLRQVFLNLLTNALKFTPPGGQVCVRTWNGENQLAVEVQDDGLGFDPAQASRLFTAFERLSDGPSDASGLGLGLAIAKGLVELHEGKITASSPGPHRGARFVVELRTVDAPAESVRPEESKMRPPGESGIVPRYRILLVEDHADTADMLRLLLEDQGYQVLTANSIDSAKQIDLSQIDAIVSDIGLPDGTGMDLMRALNRGKDQPAIALSGYGTAADIESAKQAGFDLHLTKPVDFERLLAALSSLLGSRARGDQHTG